MRKRTLFLTWYDWVNVPLAEKVRKLHRVRQRVRTIPRQVFEARFLDVKTDARVFCVKEATYRSISYKDFNLWELCKSSIADHIQRSLPPFPGAEADIARFYQFASALISGFEKLFAIEAPDQIVVEQGFQMDMRVAVEVARRRGIRTIAIENSFLRDFFFLDDATGGITNRHTASRLAWDRIRATSLDSDQRRRVRQFWQRSDTTFRHVDAISIETLRRNLGLPSDKKLALLLAQVGTDASVVMDSPLYEDQVDFIVAVAAAMNSHRDTHHVVIRLHPKEATGTSHSGVPFGNVTLRRLRTMGLEKLPHVTIVHSDQASTYQLMDCSSFGLTLTSQAGFEMLLRGKPVLVAGDAFYAHKGFTWDVSRTCQIASTLQELVSGAGLSDSQVSDVERFAYSLFFDHLYPKDLDECEDRLKEFFR